LILKYLKERYSIVKIFKDISDYLLSLFFINISKLLFNSATEQFFGIFSGIGLSDAFDFGVYFLSRHCLALTDIKLHLVGVILKQER